MSLAARFLGPQADLSTPSLGTTLLGVSAGTASYLSKVSLGSFFESPLFKALSFGSMFNTAFYAAASMNAGRMASNLLANTKMNPNMKAFLCGAFADVAANAAATLTSVFLGKRPSVPSLLNTSLMLAVSGGARNVAVLNAKAWLARAEGKEASELTLRETFTVGLLGGAVCGVVRHLYSRGPLRGLPQSALTMAVPVASSLTMQQVVIQRFFAGGK
eukprot:gnl/Chilomastix_cuspidata/988.p1 GENE.gnl/Chilomastix_cuspidata/988~~gnl/Chilomastix_cuspidata/988.p1  ORF type:complete len:217 (+),score=54.75 gnl/Chilomastix_cuspidata/988:25-675(+)